MANIVRVSQKTVQVLTLGTSTPTVPPTVRVSQKTVQVLTLLTVSVAIVSSISGTVSITGVASITF